MKASVAYESRKPKKLRWHKRGKHRLYAMGTEGRHYGIQQAERVNRAKGIFKWLLTLGGPDPAKEAIVTIKSADNLAELKAYASVHDRKPSPPADAREGRGEHDTMIPPPIPTLPASSGPPVSVHYSTTVQEKLERMGSPTPLEDVRKSAAYLQDCERGGISPEVAAAVVLGTLHHGHQHTGGKVTEFALEDRRLTQADRDRMPSSEFAIPELEALPLDTVKRIRNAPARLEMMHNAGTISEAQYRRAEHRIAVASKGHGIHSQYAREAPTGSEWEVIVSNPPAAHRGAILSLTDPGDGFEAGDRIVLWGFYDDTEASHVATAIARRYKVPVTFGPKRAVEREEGSHGRPFGEAREVGRKLSDADIVLTAIAHNETESGLAAVPDVVRLLMAPVDEGGRGWTLRHSQGALIATARAGYIELRPESGMGRLSRADAALCPLGPSGVPLSWVRDLGTAPSAPEAREAPKACGCKPFTVVSKDPELYAKCKKRADAVGPLTSPRAVYDYVREDMALLSHEEFRVIGIGARGELEGKLMTDARVAHGDQHEVKVYVEQISQILLADRPDIYYILHNHPGGDASPSPEDETLTTGIVEGLKAPCPRIVYGDHIVVAAKEFYSFREGKKTKIR